MTSLCVAMRVRLQGRRRFFKHPRRLEPWDSDEPDRSINIDQFKAITLLRCKDLPLLKGQLDIAYTCQT